MLPKCWDFVSKIAPVFPARSDQIRLLSQPADFYSELLHRIQNAKSRVILTSLYIGTGPLEQKLVQTLQSTLTNNKSVNVRILLDANRGSRGAINSRTLLYPMVSQFSSKCNVAFYHTPDLRWPLNKLLPNRYNELIGLQHMKFYLIDDTVIITGANLSSDYFTNRQDRYIVIENHRQLSDFFDDLSRVLAKISFQLSAGDTPASNSKGHTPPSDDPTNTQGTFILNKEFGLSPCSLVKRKQYVHNSRSLVMDMYNSYRTQHDGSRLSHPPPGDAGADTWISPLIEMPPFQIHIDSTVTKQVLGAASDGSSVHLGTGYFNLTQDYVDALLSKPNVHYSILMAHPTANGFLTARGLAGGIPYAYTALAARFLAGVSNLRVTMLEYIRAGWTYHAKGLWYAETEGGDPVLTLIGSPNFGERSLRRDLECSLLIISSDARLHTRLASERHSLFDSSTPFTLDVVQAQDRRPPLWVRGVLALFRHYF